MEGTRFLHADCRRKLPHTRVNCAKSGIRNFGCRWTLAEEDTPGPMQDAGRTVQPLGKCCIERGNGGLGVHLPGAYPRHLRSAFSTLDVGTGRREGAPAGPAHRQLLLCELVLGSLMMLPDDALRRLSARWAWPDLPPTDTAAPTVSYAVPECMGTACKAAYTPSLTVS